MQHIVIVVLRKGQTLKDLYDERTVLYEKYADVTICENGLNVEETIDVILKSKDKGVWKRGKLQPK